MGLPKGKKFSEKHGSNSKPDRLIKDEILKQTKNEEIPCAVAFEVARRLQISPDAVGKTADLMNFKLIKCQLGLFGYQPQKKVVKSIDKVDEALKDAIRGARVQERLSCKSAWDISSRLKIGKMKVSGACETLGIKIKDCQLGAF